MQRQNAESGEEFCALDSRAVAGACLPRKCCNLHSPQFLSSRSLARFVREEGLQAGALCLKLTTASVNHFYLIFVIFFLACFRGEFEASMVESSTHVIDDSCCSLFCLCFFFSFPFVLRSGVTHGRLLLQLKLCFCRVYIF